MRLQRLFPWAVRAAWAVLPFALGPALAAALDPRSRPVQATASVGLWGAWALVVAATLVPRPLGLTALRVAAPAALAAALWAAATEGGSAVAQALAVGSAALVVALAFLPETGIVFVNGAAYPNERRFPLRPPGPLLFGPLPLAWALSLGAPAAAALLLAAGRPVAGALVLAVGLPLAALLLRALHGLSRRWVVFVPAGVVLHDPIGLVDPVLFRRQLIEALHPAPADTDSLDLTQRAPGLALELVLTEKVPLVLMRPGRRAGEPGASARLIFTPTRPGAVLAEARARRVPAGVR